MLMSSHYIALFFLILATFHASAYAQSWQSQLQDGSRIQVDPYSNKATVTKSGVQAPLWNGVHRLENGSSVTVREGVMVPNADVVGARRGQWQLPSRQFVVDGPSACGILTRKVCGLGNECGDSSPCAFSRQLVVLEKEEERERKTGQYASAFQLTPVQCQEALNDDEFFPTCAKRRRGQGLTACEGLAHKVCGANNQCGKQPGCEPAQQLVEMEHLERLKSMDPEIPTVSTGECVQAMGDNEFFAACVK